MTTDEPEPISPFILMVARFTEEGVYEATSFFGLKNRPIDGWLFSHMVRKHICWCIDDLKDNRLTAAESVEMPQTDNDIERAPLPLSGIEVSHPNGMLKVLRATQEGQLPPAGASKGRLGFYNYNLFGTDEDVFGDANLVLLWDADATGALSLMSLVCPAGGSKWHPAKPRWVKPIPIPIPSPQAIAATINESQDDLPIEAASEPSDTEIAEEDNETGTNDE